jgi:hypothetical protein
MSHSAPTQQPSPELFFETVNAFQRTAALNSAIELDLFTAIGEGARTPAALAVRCKASERGMRILCDYLTPLRSIGGCSATQVSRLASSITCRRLCSRW